MMRALAGERTETPPIWLMRQAGRYLPEYRKLRDKAGDFLTLCYTPELAAEATLQPIRRFGFDAAILFADILLVPNALGLDLAFREGSGPQLSKVATDEDFGKLRPAEDIHDTLYTVYETVKAVRGELDSSKALIGFAGAPWTVATYMTAGRGVPGQRPAHDLMRSNRPLLDRLIETVTKATIEYLIRQIQAGADAIMLFDSWAGSLRGKSLERYSAQPIQRIANALKSKSPKTPVIAFPREAGAALESFARMESVDCVSLDSSVDLEWARNRIQPRKCVQGNLDPKALVEGGERLVSEARRIIEVLRDGPFIFNLGHGITPDASVESVEALVRAVRGG